MKKVVRLGKRGSMAPQAEGEKNPRVGVCPLNYRRGTAMRRNVHGGRQAKLS